MLAKPERLKERHLFNLVFKLGKTRNQKFHSDILSLYYLIKKKDINKLQSNSFLPKAAFLVGLKVDKRSVKRNLIKRRLRTAYKLLVNKMVNIKSKCSVLVWIGNPLIKNATFEQICSSMGRLLVKLEDRIQKV